MAETQRFGTINTVTAYSSPCGCIVSDFPPSGTHWASQATFDTACEAWRLEWRRRLDEHAGECYYR